MGVSIKKGETVSIVKAAQDAGSTAPTKLQAGAGWDAANGKKLDLDLLSVYLKDSNTAIDDENGNGSNADEALCFFGQLDIKGVHHTGDNRTGEGDGDDEQMVFTLADIPAVVTEVAIVVAIYDGADNFKEVANAFVRMVNPDDNKELAKYDLTDNYGEARAVELGRLVRNGSEWDFKATGEARQGASFKAVLEGYGVSGLQD